MRELIVFLLFLSGFSALAGAYFSFMAKASSHEAKRKSYVALKSQANAMTFIFLSGLILSQSLILASNFTAPDVPDPALPGPLPEEAVSGGTENSGEIVPPSPPEISEGSGAAAPEIPDPGSVETPAEPPPSAPPVEDGTVPTPDAGSGSIEMPDETETLPPPPQIDADVTGHAPPVLELGLEVPGNLRRGDAFSLFSGITNTGASVAKNVAVEFTLPEGVYFVSGEKSIGEIPAGETVRREFVFKSDYSTALGAGKIRVRMTYE